MFANSNSGENKTETKTGIQEKNICHAYLTNNGFTSGYGFLNQNTRPFHQVLREWMSFFQPCGNFLGQRGTHPTAYESEDSPPLEAADVFF